MGALGQSSEDMLVGPPPAEVCLSNQGWLGIPMEGSRAKHSIVYYLTVLPIDIECSLSSKRRPCYSTG